MPNYSQVANDELMRIRETIAHGVSDGRVRAWQIAEVLAKRQIALDESTIRGRFIEMGFPLSARTGNVKSATQEQKEPETARECMESMSTYRQFTSIDLLKPYIPAPQDFMSYIERPVDKKLAVHLNIGPKAGRYKYPIAQGKQGTGKTQSFRFYAWKNTLPCFLFSCYEDFKLRKLFGDKSIKDGSIIFQESLFVLAIQNPSMVIFDEINAVSNSQTFDWHALLQNRELFVKDAENGQGKIYRLHPECRIGFAQNPKSAKYIGGNIKPSNFLGRCSFITFPEFSKVEISQAILKLFPTLKKPDLDKFVAFYFAINETIERANIPVDVSIRQLVTIIDLWIHGLTLSDAIDDGLVSILDAISQPKAKESFLVIAKGVWKEMWK